MFALDSIEERLTQYDSGRGLLKIFHRHFEDVIDLVKFDREVTVVWHRNQGPAFMGYAMKSARQDDLEIPKEVNGVELKTLLRQMAIILQDKGSAELRLIIGEHLLTILNTMTECNSINEILNKIKQAG
jgi:hypothetical protein